MLSHDISADYKRERPAPMITGFAQLKGNRRGSGLLGLIVPIMFYCFGAVSPPVSDVISSLVGKTLD